MTRYRCPICEKEFGSESAVTGHMSSHKNYDREKHKIIKEGEDKEMKLRPIILKNSLDNIVSCLVVDAFFKCGECGEMFEAKCPHCGSRKVMLRI